MRAHATRFGTQNRQNRCICQALGEPDLSIDSVSGGRTEEELRLEGESSGTATTWTECAVEQVVFLVQTRRRL